MKRRDIIKSAGLAGLSLATMTPSLSSSIAEPIPIKEIENMGFFKFKLGELELISVTDGHGLFKPAQPFFAPAANNKEVQQVQYDNFLPSDTVDLAFNILVVRKDNRIILFDTGSGILFGPAAGKIVDSLRVAGIESKDVSDIILTHAHPDHIGGIVDGAMNLTFPNADVHVANAEYKFWTSSNPDFSKCKGDDKVYGQLIEVARKHFAAVKRKLKFFDSGDVLFGFISLKVIPGHTPGHTISTISSGEDEIIHMADISHDHTILLSHPEWGVIVDTDFHLAGTARRNTLENLSDQRAFIFSYHLPWPGLGHIRKKGPGFEWIPKAYATTTI